MYKNLYCKPVMKIKMSATDFLICKEAYKPEELLQIFLEETKRCYYTSMHFPSRVVSGSERQVHQQNYDYFVHTMADMIKKYAPEIIE